MNGILSDEQRQLRDSVRRFLNDCSPESEVRRLMEDERGYDQGTWLRMAREIGLQGLAIPEEYGGLGGSYTDLAVVFEEFGKTLACAPLFSTVALAVSALVNCDDEDAKREYLPVIADGELTATLAVTEDDGRWDESGIRLEASRSQAGWVLTGHKAYVIDGATADLILTPAQTGEGIGIFAVQGSAPGVTRTSLAVLDPTRKQARVEFARAPARMIGQAGDGWRVTARALSLAAVALAAEQVGGAQRLLDMTVGYAKIRQQFGRPIGSFQAIKHKCTDMLIEIEAARSAAYAAASAAAGDAQDARVKGSLAKAYCSDAYVHAASEAIQIHGGIGFTWEHPAHLYYRRAKTSQLYLGDAHYHRRLLTRLIGICPATDADP
jgi:alkylation response protein AidB-like acyl-CoA dehydrogenase